MSNSQRFFGGFYAQDADSYVMTGKDEVGPVKVSEITGKQQNMFSNQYQFVSYAKR